MPLYIGLINYNKAFDSIKHEYLLEVLKNQGTFSDYTILIEKMYTELKASIKIDTIGEYFRIKKRGQTRRSTFSFLFNSSLEEIFQNLEWEGRGLNLNGKHLTNLRFVDNITLFSKSLEELVIMMTELAAQSIKAGLPINTQKTKILTQNVNQKPIIIQGESIELVKEGTYLRQILSFEIYMGNSHKIGIFQTLEMTELKLFV